MKRNIKIIFITLLEMVKNIGGVFIMLNVMLCYTFFLLNYLIIYFVKLLINFKLNSYGKWSNDAVF